MKIVGCDLHARQQTIAMVDTDTGWITAKTLPTRECTTSIVCSPRRSGGGGHRSHEINAVVRDFLGPDSCILGSIHYPHPLPLRYVVEKCERGSLIRYLAHSTQSGFATHRAIRFEQRQGPHGLRSIRMQQASPRLRSLVEATGS